MKYLKRFNEGIDIASMESSFNEVISMVEDIMSISYILEDSGLDIEFVLKLSGNFSLLPHYYRKIGFSEVSDLKRMVSSFILTLKNSPNDRCSSIDSLYIKIENPYVYMDGDDRLTLDEVEFIELVKRYKSLLGEHLDYIEGDSIKMTLLCSEYAEIKIKINKSL